MAEEKETKTTTKKTSTKTTSKASTTKKAPAKTETSAEREKKEALRREVLDHYNRKQSLRPAPVVSDEVPQEVIEDFEPVMTEDYEPVMTEDYDYDYTEEMDTAPVELATVPYTPTNTFVDEPTTFAAPTTPTLGTNLKAQTPPDSKIKIKDPNRGKNARMLMSYLFSTKDGLFYIAGFVKKT